MKALLKIPHSLLNKVSSCVRSGALRKPVLAAGILTVLAALALAGWVVQRVLADAVEDQTEVDAAIESTLEAVLNNAGCPTDPNALQATVAVAFGFLHPELAASTQPEDPASVQARADAAATFLNPWAYEAELMKDPVASQQREEALRTLTQGLRP